MGVSVECLRFERELSNPWEEHRLVVVGGGAEVREEETWRRNVSGVSPVSGEELSSQLEMSWDLGRSGVFREAETQE